MDEVEIKVEVEDDSPNCLICLQPVSFVINQERLNSLNFLFNYLEVDRVEVYVCDKCGEKVGKFVKLLEKIRLEMDYLLDSIKSDILKSNNFKPVCGGVACVRKMIVEKCTEKMQGQQLKVILERLDSSKVNGGDQSLTSKWSNYKFLNDNRKPQRIRQRPGPTKITRRRRIPTTVSASGDWTPNLDDASNSTSTKEDYMDGSSPNPVIDEVDIKPDVYFEDSTIPERKASRRYYCQVPGCDMSYSTTPKLDGHYKAKHPDFSAPLKRRRSNVMADKFDVIVENGDSFWCCKLCEKKFKSWKTAKQHLKKVHGPKKFLCSECGYATAVKEQLRLHVKRVHKKDLMEADIPDLNQSLESISATPVWERGSGGDTEEPKAEDDISNPDPTPSPIPTADDDFSPNLDEGSNLNSNLPDDILNETSTATPLDSENNLKSSRPKKKKRLPEMTKCPTCSKIFSHKGHLKIHMNSVHLGIRRFKCSTCSKSYDSSIDLQDHIHSIHLKIKAHLCDICGNSFGYKRDLRQHRESVHFKLKRHICDRCSASFTQRSSLNQHTRNVHLGIKRKTSKS